MSWGNWEPVPAAAGVFGVRLAAGATRWGCGTAARHRGAGGARTSAGLGQQASFSDVTAFISPTLRFQTREGWKSAEPHRSRLLVCNQCLEPQSVPRGHLTLVLLLLPVYSWEIMDPGRDGPSGPAPQPGDSLRLFLQETSVFKQQNPGKVKVAASRRASARDRQ